MSTTERDSEVLALWAGGRTVREIADELGLDRSQVMDVVAASVATRRPTPKPAAPAAAPRPAAVPRPLPVSPPAADQGYRPPRSVSLTGPGATAAGSVFVELVAIPLLTPAGAEEIARMHRAATGPNAQRRTG